MILLYGGGGEPGAGEIPMDLFRKQAPDPVQIANWIMVNHWGTLITNKPIRLEPSERINNAYRDIDPEEDWNYEGSVATVKEYMEKNPPAAHKEKEHEPTR